MSRLDWRVEAPRPLRGDIRVPGDKSISHRAVMFAALADGVSDVEGFLNGDDCLATMRAVEALGAEVEHLGPTRLRIRGLGGRPMQTPAAPLDLGNSGTSMRLFCGLLAGRGVAVTLEGDESLSRRPMRRVLNPLAQMGAQIDSTDAGTAPLHIHPVSSMQGMEYALPMASAQVKSAVLLAGLSAEGQTTTIEPAPTRDHTERMLQTFGVEVSMDGAKASLQGGQMLHAARVEVPSDLSSAAFFLVAAAISPESELILRQVGTNPTRDGVLRVLKAMGARIDYLEPRLVGGEPVADLRVTGGDLQGVEIGAEWVALGIDEIPALCIAAAAAKGTTTISGAEELKVKESDRLGAMVRGLRALGVSVEERPDGMVIEGQEQWSGGDIDADGDHRIAMAFAVAALRATAPIHIADCANVNTSFPGFAELVRRLGFELTEQWA
nr:3-phosphoshikimate 1-carboxyvinyltransferase [Oceanococcus sp. HetDA_MAG_MS8]